MVWIVSYSADTFPLRTLKPTTVSPRPQWKASRTPIVDPDHSAMFIMVADALHSFALGAFSVNTCRMFAASIAAVAITILVDSSHARMTVRLAQSEDTVQLGAFSIDAEACPIHTYSFNRICVASNIVSKSRHNSLLFMGG